MKTLIIYAHPYEKSFNHAILQETIRLLDEKGKEYHVIDLYADNFNPAFSAAELALYKEGQALDPLVKDYQQHLLASERLVFIFPVWWYDTPAIVKGFLDKVMLNPFAFRESKTGLVPQLTHIRDALVITTSIAPTLLLRILFGNAIRGVLIKSTLRSVIGKGKGRWVNFGSINTSSLQKRQAFLQKLQKHIEK